MLRKSPKKPCARRCPVLIACQVFERSTRPHEWDGRERLSPSLEDDPPWKRKIARTDVVNSRHAQERGLAHRIHLQLGGDRLVGDVVRIGDRHRDARNVTIEDVGKSALYLLSDLGSGVTGENLHVDAGYHVVGMKAVDAPDIDAVTGRK